MSEKIYYSTFGVHNANNKAFFNCNNDEGRQIDSFVLDFNTNEKIVFTKAPDESQIMDFSPCGTKVLTIDRTYDKRKRFTKIFDLKTKELLFETKTFFGYEARFTSVENRIVCRADVKGKSSDKLFVFNIETNEIEHFMTGNACLVYCDENAEKSIFAYPSTRKKDEVILLDLKTLEEKTIHLGAKKLIHRVLSLGNDEYFAFDGDFIPIRFNIQGDIIWKGKKLDWEELYYAPYCYIFDNQVFFNVPDKTLNLENGEIIEKPFEIIGHLKSYFQGFAMNNTGSILNLTTGEVTRLGIEKMVNCQYANF